MSAPEPGHADAVREAAARAIGLGYTVLALHGVRADGACTCPKGLRCPTPGKHPRGKGWQETADALAAFRRLTDGLDALNLGVFLDIYAAVPLLVIDVDVKHNKPGAASLAQLEAECGPLPGGALLQHTPSGGSHYLLRMPSGIDPHTLPTTIEILPGLDLLTHRRQFVLSPSRTAEGAYVFADAERGLPAPLALPVLPPAWAERLQQLAATTRAHSPETSACAVSDPAPDTRQLIQLLTLLPAPGANTRDECVSFAIAVHGALAGASPEVVADAQEAYLRWAARWPGANPEHDRHIWETTTSVKQRGWTHVLSDARRFLELATTARPSEDGGVTDGADVTGAAALLAVIQAEAAQREFDVVPGAVMPVAVVHVVRAVPTAAAVSAEYRDALRLAVSEARRDIPQGLERQQHFDVIAASLAARFRVHSRAVRDNLRALDALVDRAGVFCPEIEWLGPDDRDRLASASPRYLVGDYIFADGAIHIVYGAPGSRKTFLGLSWLLAVTSGHAWVNRFPVEQGGALFFAGEAPASLRVRRAAALDALSITPEAAANIPFGVVPELPPLGSVDGVDATMRLIDTHYRERHPNVPLRLIVFDTLTRLSQRAGSSTTDPKEYGNLLDRVDTIAKLTNSSILLIAHSPEGDADKPTGTYQTRGNADSVMKVERVDGESSRLIVQKAKDDVEGTPLLLRFDRRDVRLWLAASYEREHLPLPEPLSRALSGDLGPVVDLQSDQFEEKLDANATIETTTLRRQFISLALVQATPDGLRGVNKNGRDQQAEEHVRAWVQQHPGATLRGLRNSWHGKLRRVDKVVSQLQEEEVIVNRGSASRGAYFLVESDGEAEAPAAPASPLEQRPVANPVAVVPATDHAPSQGSQNRRKKRRPARGRRSPRPLET